MMTTETLTLERLLDPLRDCFTKEVAERIVALRTDAATQAKLDHYAEQNKEGRLTTKERAEYESCIQALDVIAILQAKARAVLENGR